MPSRASAKNQWDFRRGIATARVLVQLGCDHGASLDALLSGTQITPAQLEQSEGEIEASQEIQLIRNLLQALPHIPTLGLQAGTRYHITTYGLWGYAVLSSPTLGDAFSMGSRMLNQTFSLTTHKVEQLGNQVQITCFSEHLPEDVRQFILDRDRSAAITLQRELLGKPVPYNIVMMQRAEPSAELADAYTQVFSIRPLFGQTHDRSLLDAAVMHAPLPQANEHTAQMCEAMCRKLVEARSIRSGMADTVRNRLLRTPGHIPDMEEIAAEMRVTSRTLRRHLTAEGVTFRSLLEEVRSTLTEELMATADLTHGEIATRLGYADVTTFIEAFRRWKGMPPSAFRREQGLARGVTGRGIRRRFIPR